MLLKRLCVGVLLVLISACGLRDKDLAAKVNGEGIAKKDFETEVARNLARYQKQGRELPPGIEMRIRESVLRRMIDDKIFELKAQGLKLEVSKEDLGKQFEEHKARFRTAEAFEDYLKRSGNTVESIQDDLRRNLVRDRVVEKLSGTVEVADDEVQKYYDEHLARFTEREQVRASRILVRVTPTATAVEKKAAQKEAKAILAKVKQPKADFAAIAKESSKGPEAANGGDLGWFSRGRMGVELDLVVFGPAPQPEVAPGTPPNAAVAPTPGAQGAKDKQPAAAPAAKDKQPATAPAVKPLEPNQISDVVETKLGYEIVKVFERKPERRRPLDEVKESIKSSLLARKRNEKRRDVLRTLKTEAKVEQLLKFEAPPPAAGMAPGSMAAPGVLPTDAGKLPPPVGAASGAQPAPAPAASQPQ